VTDPNIQDSRFSIERARAYWRHAPSGAGKHDTAVLSTQSDEQLLATWDEAFRRRFTVYPEEMTFLRVFAQTAGGRRLLSIGSGLGFHELHYLSRGAIVTCADIVPSNLEVIQRVARLRHLGPVQTVLLDDETDFPGGAFETVFVYGSLMAMPADAQRTLLARAAKAMAPDGRIVLMLYTWEFARRTCGWESPEQFDPLVFARASDPTVGEEACPWSDWHDDAKLLGLAPPGFAVTRRQLWNDGVYVWYELRRQPPGPMEPFFTDSDHYEGQRIAIVGGDSYAPDEADRRPADDDCEFTTTVSRFSYAAVLPPRPCPPGVTCVDVRLDLLDGAVSLGLLDVSRGAFVATAVVADIGPNLVRLLPAGFPREFQVIVSNHHPVEPGTSRFRLHQTELVAATVINPPDLRLKP
jgi:SAM-dependent methyltransferase